MRIIKVRSYLLDSREAWTSLFIVACTLWVYVYVLPGKFVWDDDLSLRQNTLLQSFGGLWAIWTTIGGIPGETHWWPLTYTVFWIEHRLFNWNAVWFHLVNILLHLFISVRVLKIAERFPSRISSLGAFFGAMFFALHPIHVEDVAWVIELKDLLAVTFGLLAVEAFLNNAERPHWTSQATAIAAMAAAMLSKSSAVVIPASMALIVWWRSGRISRAEVKMLIPVTLVAAAFAFVDWRINAMLYPGGIAALPILDRICAAGFALLSQAMHLIIPFGLSVIYPPFSIDPSRPLAWVPTLACLAITSILWLFRGSIGRGPFACWAFYSIALAPTLGLLRFNFLNISPYADRFQYLASIAPLAGAGALLGNAFDKSNASRRKAIASLAAGVLVILGIQTSRCARTFSSQDLLFANAAAMTPSSELAWENLSLGLYSAGKTEESLNALQNAWKLDPDKIERSGNLGFLLQKNGRDAEAVLHMRNGLNLTPENPALIGELAWIVATSADPGVRNPKEALELAHHMDRMHPAPNARYLNILAAAEASGGDFEIAAENARLALKLAPSQGLDAAERAEIEGRLELYSQGRPFIRPGPSKRIVPPH